MRTGPLALALFGLFTSWAWAELPPIKPEVWEVKESDTQGFGAIILERSIKFHAKSVEHVYLIRVVNEQGRGAVEFPKFLPSTSIEGRTVTRDGIETPFKASADFQTKALVETGRGVLNRTSMVPPGLTSDCVVQVRWTESAFFVSATRFWDYKVQDRIFPLASRIPTRRLELEVYDDLAWAYDLQTGPRGAIVQGGKGFRRATFTNLPAYEWVPYSEESAKDNPRFILYQQPDHLMLAAQKGEGAYWVRVANSWYRPYYDGKVQYGKIWGSFADEIRKDLPAAPQAAALELIRRLRNRFLDVTALLPSEKAARTEKQNDRKIDPRDFGEALKTGETNGDGLHLLFWALADGTKIQPKPIMLVDRRERRLRIQQCNLAQLDRWCLLIEEEGKPPMILDLERRFARPDLVLPKHQDTEALVLVPKESIWSYKVLQVPLQDGSFNTRTVQVRVEVGLDRDRIRLESSSTGIPDWVERAEWWDMTPEERNKQLKKSIEKKDSNIQVEKAAVGPYTAGPLTWSCEASRDREAFRNLVVYPFPLLDPPLGMPMGLPAKRTERIVLSHIGLHEYQATIICPSGYSWTPSAELRQSNRFGDVLWVSVAGTSPGEVRVTLRVHTIALVSPPGTYQEFRQFLGWIQDAMGRSLVLTRSTS